MLSRTIITLTTLMLALLLHTAAAAVSVATTSDLRADARLALQKHVPVLLVFTASDCGYCDLLESDILRPMLISGDYDNKVIIRKIVIDEQDSVHDFNGKTISTSALVKHYGIYVTPTMLFLDAHGKELSERILGINTPEMFGGRVDAAIAESLARLRGRAQQPAAKLAQQTN